ncbi:hypothetical protein JCGZ_25560 [Jatropha curcas]|uniref:Uncharacterized protein n=1 Tax=Jatropha curcas TaxID=180498 RepID=A0A067JYN7_JATCU|nr:hypothetical protein JCGZ_25560 [Jatropha curcas]
MDARNYVHEFHALTHANMVVLSTPGGHPLGATSMQITSSTNWLAFVDGALFPAADFAGFGAVFEHVEGSFTLAISGYKEGTGVQLLLKL